MSVRVRLDALAAGERTLAVDAGHYVLRVLRLRAGDRFVAFDPHARVECDGEVVHEDGTTVRVRLDGVRAAAVVAPRPAVLVQGLPKGDKPDAIVRDATELGATAIVFATCARTVVRVDADGAKKKIARWERIAEQAARQAGRGDVPALDLAPWEAALASVPATSARFCLWERATAPLGPALTAAGDAGVAFAVGPEGGLTEEEVAAARDAGWTIASLGPIVLRTETVAAAVLGALRILS